MINLHSSRNLFFVFLTGNTNGAHCDLVEKLKDLGHTEVNAPEECDYVVVFCPVASRVGAEVSRALSKMPAGKQTVLVVMHHTFNPEHCIAESRRLVTNSNIFTVDCLFYENHFLQCKENDDAWHKIQNHLGVSQISTVQKVENSIRRCECDFKHLTGDETIVLCVIGKLWVQNSSQVVKKM